MSQLITEAFAQQYNGNVQILYQRDGAKLRGTVREVSLTGAKVHYFERLGATAAIKKTTRHGNTPQVDSQHSRRQVSMVDYEWADLVDDQDKIRILISPESEYAINAAMALGRAFDQELIDAFFGDAKSGETGGTTVTFPAGQIIANGGTNMTVAKLRSAKLLLDDANVPDSERVLVYSPAALSKLLSDTNVTSSDFNTVRALVAGELNTFLGFRFIAHTGLPKAANIRKCFAYHKRAMGIAVGKNITTKIDPRIDKSYSMQVYACGTFGATRIEDEGVVEIDIDESA